jgi:hypothetical protein
LVYEEDNIEPFEAWTMPSGDLKIQVFGKTILLGKNFPLSVQLEQNQKLDSPSIADTKNASYRVELRHKTVLTKSQIQSKQANPIDLSFETDHRLISMVKFGHSYLELGSGQCSPLNQAPIDQTVSFKCLVHNTKLGIVQTVIKMFKIDPSKKDDSKFSIRPYKRFEVSTGRESEFYTIGPMNRVLGVNLEQRINGIELKYRIYKSAQLKRRESHYGLGNTEDNISSLVLNGLILSNRFEPSCEVVYKNNALYMECFFTPTEMVSLDFDFKTAKLSLRDVSLSSGLTFDLQSDPLAERSTESNFQTTTTNNTTTTPL